jgi:iron complex outermembrane receptor protein
MFKNSTSKITRFLITGCVLGLSHPALANTDAAEKPAGGSDEILVTARKRTESLQEVPISISALGRDEIERLNVNDLGDLAKSVAGFTWSVSNSPLDARPAMRGQSNIRTASQPTVGVFVDGNSVPWRSGLNLQSVDVERIEVVKGPQSALFGRGVLAGAVNYVTRRPGKEFGGYVEGLAGGHGLLDFRARLDLPLSETVSVAATGRVAEFGGFFKNSLTGKAGVGATDAASGTLSLLWEPTSNFSAYIRGAYSDEWQAQPARQAVDSNTQTGPGETQVWFIGQVSSNSDLIANNCDDCGGFGRKVTWTTANLQWDALGGTITSMSAYNRTDMDSDLDTDYTGEVDTQLPLSIYRNGFRLVVNRHMTSFGQEVRFASDAKKKFRYLFGAYYYRETSDEKGKAPIGTTVNLADWPIVPKVDRTRAIAAFGSVDLDVTDKLTLGGEIRWNQEKGDVDFIYQNQPSSLSGSWTSWLPRFTVDYKVSPDVMLYASAAKGNKPGGFNTALGAGTIELPVQFLKYAEEKAWTYEVGVKTRLFDRKLTLNVAAFWTDWTDIQINTTYFPPAPLPGRVNYTSNGSRVQIRGGEIELNWRPNDRLSISANYAYNPARIFDYQLPGATSSNVSSLGTRHLSFSSDHQANGSVNYTAPLKDGWTWFAQANGEFLSSQYATEANLAYTGDRVRADLRLGVSSKTWQVTAFVLNLFNDKTPDNLGTNLNPRTLKRNFIVATPDPRQWGVKIRRSF